MNRNQSFSGRSLIRFLAFLPLSLSAFLSAYAAPLPTGAFTIQDRGQSRTFEIATNEIHLITRARHHELRAIAPLADPEAVRQHADSLRKSTGEETDLGLKENYFLRFVKEAKKGENAP